MLYLKHIFFLWKGLPDMLLIYYQNFKKSFEFLEFLASILDAETRQKMTIKSHGINPYAMLEITH